MATSLSSRHLMAALVAGFALSFAPTAPVHADEGPSVRAPRARTAVRVRDVAVGYPFGCGGCSPRAAAYEPVYYAPRFYDGCGRCALPVALPYYWAIRWARYRYTYHHYRFYE